MRGALEISGRLRVTGGSVDFETIATVRLHSLDDTGRRKTVSDTHRASMAGRAAWRVSSGCFWVAVAAQGSGRRPGVSLTLEETPETRVYLSINALRGEGWESSQGSRVP